MRQCKVAVNVSRGAEPIRVNVTGLAPIGFTYATDSVLPDGTSIAALAGLGDVEQWTCDCVQGDCSIGGQNQHECVCVASFGNFYGLASESETEASPHRRQILLLDALPLNLPLVECAPTCPCGDACTNKVTQRGITVPVSAQPSTTGLGAFYTPSSPTDSLPRGTFISLYAGEYLTTEQAKQRWAAGYGDNYILSVRLPDQTVHIDPRHVGNFGRFLNHSCDPNCVVVVVKWGAGRSWPRAAIFSRRIIRAGDELTFDYGSGSAIGNAPADTGRTKCECGAAVCRGYIPFDGSL